MPLTPRVKIVDHENGKRNILLEWEETIAMHAADAAEAGDEEEGPAGDPEPEPAKEEKAPRTRARKGTGK